jgi:hypothetical protein
MQQASHLLSSVGSAFSKYRQNFFICVLGSALASLSWRLSTNKSTHTQALEGTMFARARAFLGRFCI